MKNNNAGKFIKYCYEKSKGDYELFAYLMYIGMVNNETGEKTVKDLIEAADILLEIS